MKPPWKRPLLLSLCALSCLFACDSDLARKLGDNPTLGADAGLSVDSPLPTAGGDSSDGSKPDAINPAQPSEPGGECADEVRNGLETAADCGGGQCSPCDLGQRCLENSDCQSGLCFVECIATGCDNEFRDDNESDEDCGGVCDPCNDGLKCNGAADCKSGVCGEDGRCAAATCRDDVKNGIETGIDCGNEAGCPSCPDGQGCTDEFDCQSEVCIANVCALPRCADDRKNGDESDVDCGGDCPACDVDQKCNIAADCGSNNCQDDGSGTLRCQVSQCDDRVKNGDETDVDCGGSCDARCVTGERCEADSDCEELVCLRGDADDYRVCQAASCDDEVQNGDEPAADCGGSCAPCGDDSPCFIDTDCESGVCDDTCQPASCDDEHENQDESDVDCGGDSCDACGYARTCNDDSDCASDSCSDGQCDIGFAGAECFDDADCLSADCSAGICLPGGFEAVCQSEADCYSGSCAEGSCAKSSVGAACDEDVDCFSARCRDAVCEPGDNGATCSVPEACASGRCENNSCAALDLQLITDGVSEQPQVTIQYAMSAGSVPMQRDEIAIMYFFTPEARTNLVKQDESTPAPARSLCVEVTNSQWAYIWQSSMPGQIGSTGERYNVRLRDVSNAPFTNADDHSYRQSFGANPNLVVCRLVNGSWRQVQGQAPVAVENPCDFVEPDCEELTCDNPNQ